MTLQQLRDLTSDMPGNTEILFHDGFNEETEPATIYRFEDLGIGDPIRLKVPPSAILISGIGEEIEAERQP